MARKHRAAHRALRRAEREHAERVANTGAREPLFGIAEAMWQDVTAWIAEYRRRFVGRAQPGELRAIRVHVVDPEPAGRRPVLERLERPVIERPERPVAATNAQRPAAPKPPPDRFPYLRAMDRLQLMEYARNSMSVTERLELERELNERIRAERRGGGPRGDTWQ